MINYTYSGSQYTNYTGNYWNDYSGADNNIGDGNITNTIERTITHSYSSANDYTVKLTVTDNASATGSMSKVITIRPFFSVHNLNSSEDFLWIQEAIYDSNTTDGHIIEVRPGTYTENVKVNKSLTIRSFSENPATTIVQAANPGDHAFTITANHVNISGFTIKKNAYTEACGGIYILSSSNNGINFLC